MPRVRAGSSSSTRTRRAGASSTCPPAPRRPTPAYAARRPSTPLWARCAGPYTAPSAPPGLHAAHQLAFTPTRRRRPRRFQRGCGYDASAPAGHECDGVHGGPGAAMRDHEIIAATWSKASCLPPHPPPSPPSCAPPHVPRPSRPARLAPWPGRGRGSRRRRGRRRGGLEAEQRRGRLAPRVGAQPRRRVRRAAAGDRPPLRQPHGVVPLQAQHERGRRQRRPPSEVKGVCYRVRGAEPRRPSADIADDRRCAR